jgi:hypothetical protein
MITCSISPEAATGVTGNSFSIFATMLSGVDVAGLSYIRFKLIEQKSMPFI